MKVYWCVRKDKMRVYFEHFSEAWYDWTTHPGEVRFIYPVVRSPKWLANLREHDGW